MRAAHARPILVGAGGQAAPLEGLLLGGKGFSEQWLQRLLHNHPACLPVAEIEPGFGELVSVGMEVQTKHGPIDNLFLTPDGDIVLVETKLWRNPEARRQVVAQALDYASYLFEWDYEELERAILKSSFGESPKPARLYDLLADENGLAEPAFIDAVNTNLRKGRVLILVVGDGIRTEAKRLTSLLQSHAGAHFTFALVELSVFRLDEQGGVVVCPRVLTQTEMISRGVVEILDHRTVVSAHKEAPGATASKDGALKSQPESITAEQFYDAMAELRSDLPDRLRAFVGKLASLGVEADFQRALNLKWDPPVGRPINFGTIQRNGQVWTDAVNAHAPHDLSHRYIEEIASAFGMDIEKEAFKGAWHVRSHNRAPRIQEIADKLDFWGSAIEQLIIAIKARLADQDA